MVVGILGFWLLGLPVSLLLAFGLDYGPAGLWWGLVLGLVVVALFLLLRVRQKLRQPLRRVHLDAPRTDQWPVLDTVSAAES
jgi:MATE family multidrug resistance protein